MSVLLHRISLLLAAILPLLEANSPHSTVHRELGPRKSVPAVALLRREEEEAEMEASPVARLRRRKRRTDLGSPVRAEEGSSASASKKEGDDIPEVLKCIKACSHVKNFDIDSKPDCGGIQQCEQGFCDATEKAKLQMFLDGGCDFGLLEMEDQAAQDPDAVPDAGADAAVVLNKVEWEYDQLDNNCEDVAHIGDKLEITRVDDCQTECNKNGQCRCFGVSEDGCYLKKACKGKVAKEGEGFNCWRKKAGGGAGGCMQNTSTKCSKDDANACGTAFGSTCAQGEDDKMGWCFCEQSGCFSNNQCIAVKGTCNKVVKTHCKTSSDCNLARDTGGSAICAVGDGEDSGQCHCEDSQKGSEMCAWTNPDQPSDMSCIIPEDYWKHDALKRHKVSKHIFRNKAAADANVSAVPEGSSEKGGPPGPRGIAGRSSEMLPDFPEMTCFYMVFAMNLIVLTCGCYWTKRNLIDRKPPYGLKISTLKSMPPGGFGHEDDEEEEDGPGHEAPKEEVYYVAGAGHADYNGRYVKSHEDRDGVHFWMKKKPKEEEPAQPAEGEAPLEAKVKEAHEHVDAHEIWREGGKWVLGYWPSDHAKDLADDHDASAVLEKTVWWAAEGEAQEMPPDGKWQPSSLVDGKVVPVEIPEGGTPEGGTEDPHHTAPVVDQRMEAVEGHEKMIDKGPCPPELYIICSHGWKGKYIKLPSELAGGWPIWKHETNEDYIFTCQNGHWMVGDEDEKKVEFKCDSGNICSLRPHKGVRWPHQAMAGNWRRFDPELVQWVEDATIKVQTTPEAAGFALAMPSLSFW